LNVSDTCGGDWDTTLLVAGDELTKIAWLQAGAADAMTIAPAIAAPTQSRDRRLVLIVK
jgi:hypothetical protein